MKIERWYWLPAFCFVSLCIHLALVLNTPSIAAERRLPPVAEMEVTLVPLPEPPKPVVKEKPKDPPAPTPKKEHAKENTPIDKPSEKRLAKVAPPKDAADSKSKTPKVIAKNVPTQPNADPGGIKIDAEEKPLPMGIASGRKDAGAPKLRMAKAEAQPGGGGSPAPGPIPGGKGGAPGPEAPPEDIIYNGGGAGGLNLPKAAPRIGGGGGNSILSVENQLAKDLVPEEKPGLGPGLGSGQGAGAGGGVGYGRAKGIGTQLNSGPPIATLKAKPGVGIGAGKGDQIGTRAPGGGKGTGAELPGTGGTGTGYGRGSGVGLGSGTGVGIGDGDSGSRVGLTRGIPFGDITGLLNGNPNGGRGLGGGPGGPGRGSVFGKIPAGGGGGKVNIVYLLDTSGSMAQGNKIGKARAALKKALSELKPSDTFDVVNFARNVYGMSYEMMPASAENIEKAMEYVDKVPLQHDTNMSGGLEAALGIKNITHVFLLSDGEPSIGIRNFAQLRKFVIEKNTQKAHIITLALGLGEQFIGIELLKGIAEDNQGQFSYIDLSKRAVEEREKP